MVGPESALQMLDGGAKRRVGFLGLVLRLQSASKCQVGPADFGRKRSGLRRVQRHLQCPSGVLRRFVVLMKLQLDLRSAHEKARDETQGLAVLLERGFGDCHRLVGKIKRACASPRARAVSPRSKASEA